jgi:plastocyanin
MRSWIKLVIFSVVVVSLISVQALWAGSISGTIKYEGKVPKFKPLKMGGDPVCHMAHTEPVYPEILVLGEGNRMANVLVSITKGLPEKDYPVPTEPVILDQKGCKYSPHVFGIRVGQGLKILNPDGTLHNVHAMPKENAEFNLAMPAFRKTAMKKFNVEEVKPFPLKCDVHPWMTSWAAVMTHPFFTVTGIDGSFMIDGLDPGEYEIQAWHEKLGVRKAIVTVTDSVETSDFTFRRAS